VGIGVKPQAFDLAQFFAALEVLVERLELQAEVLSR
jgi:hypothetical protein